MKLKFAKNRMALHICLALAAGALTVSCAGNGSKKAQTTKMEQTTPMVTISKNETPVENKIAETRQEKTQDVVAQDIEHSAAAVIAYPDVDLGENTKPEQLVFRFGFDKSELSDKDREIIIQHAHYLFDNPEMILKIQGHTDQYGPKAYNEYLSKKRSDAVAKILIEQGVQESQLKIIAMANEAPLTDTEDTRLNRRVELEYNEINLVSTN